MGVDIREGQQVAGFVERGGRICGVEADDFLETTVTQGEYGEMVDRFRH